MTTKAIVFVEKGKAEIREVARPKLRDDYVLVKVKAVGVNPTDWKHVDFGITAPGSRVGCDYAGVVEEVGSKVEKSFEKGDRISGVVRGSDQTNLENGAFADYIVAKGDVQIKTPDNVSDEDAATLGISICTVASTEPSAAGLPLPGKRTTKGDDEGEYILIYGGSTATGIYGIQFARLSGLRVVATASPRNFDYLRSLGASAVFDYNAPTVAADICAHTGDALRLAWDCTGSGGFVCAGGAEQRGGGGGGAGTRRSRGRRRGREALAAANPKVDGPHATLMYSVFGERFVKGGSETPAKPEEFEFARTFWEVTRGLLAEGRVRAPRVFVNRGGGGLEGVLKGMDELRGDRVSGGKLVYTL